MDTVIIIIAIDIIIVVGIITIQTITIVDLVTVDLVTLGYYFLSCSLVFNHTKLILYLTLI